MIRAKLADITKLRNVQAITNAANGVGVMAGPGGGGGVAGAIARAAGEDFRKSVYKYCREQGGFEEGEVYVTPSGNLSKIGIESVYHAVTMRLPGGPTSYDIVTKVSRKLFETAVSNKVESIAVPGLGTGIGRLDPVVVAQIMAKVAQEFTDRIKIAFVDIDEIFIKEVQRNISVG